jgi:hypothetical protein
VTATSDIPAEPTVRDEFPCDSFKAAARHLRRPFTPAAVRFKVQATWPKDNPTGGLVVAYIDARLVTERLNLVVPHLWHDAYRAVGSGQMWCDLTIDGITRSDVGEGQGKALVSDSFKRAGVRFGIGVSLYAIPKMMLDVQSGSMKQKRTKDGLSLVLTPRGETICRDSYTAWLDHHGRQAFGDPLDHGDVLDAQGDHETDAPVAPEGVDPETGEIGQADPPRIAQVKRLLRKHRATTTGIRTVLRGAGVPVTEGENPIPLVDSLSPAQASAVIEFLTVKSDVPRAAPGEFEHPPAQPTLEEAGSTA